jgi:CTP-dependent riboflavin kinase
MGPGEDRERDNRSGRFTPEYDLKDFVEAVEKLERASTQDVADELGCSYDLAYRRLKELSEEKELKGEKIGNTYHWTPIE